MQFLLNVPLYVPEINYHICYHTYRFWTWCRWNDIIVMLKNKRTKKYDETRLSEEPQNRKLKITLFNAKKNPEYSYSKYWEKLLEFTQSEFLSQNIFCSFDVFIRKLLYTCSRFHEAKIFRCETFINLHFIRTCYCILLQSWKSKSDIWKHFSLIHRPARQKCYTRQWRWAACAREFVVKI